MGGGSLVLILLEPIHFGADMCPSDLKIVLPVTADVGNLSPKFEGCTVFRFRVNSGHGTDRQTDTM